MENDTDRTVSSDSESELGEDSLAVGDNNNARTNLDNMWSKLLYPCSWQYLSCHQKCQPVEGTEGTSCEKELYPHYHFVFFIEVIQWV